MPGMHNSQKQALLLMAPDLIPKKCSRPDQLNGLISIQGMGEIRDE